MTTLYDDAGGQSKPHVRAAAYDVGGRFGIDRVLGFGHRGNETEHDDGLALDFMTRNGSPLAEYMRANATRYGVTYVIWAQRIWSVARAGEGWRPMEDRGSPTANHLDHVHVSFAPSVAGSPTMPTVPPTGSIAGNDPAVVAGLLDPLPWLKDKLVGQVDEATAAIVRAVTGYVIAGVLVAGGLALVVAGLARSARKQSREETP